MKVYSNKISTSKNVEQMNIYLNSKISVAKKLKNSNYDKEQNQHGQADCHVVRPEGRYKVPSVVGEVKRFELWQVVLRLERLCNVDARFVTAEMFIRQQF